MKMGDIIIHPSDFQSDSLRIVVEGDRIRYVYPTKVTYTMKNFLPVPFLTIGCSSFRCRDV